MAKKYETQFDMMTKQPVEQLILKLGLPTTISMLVTSLYNMADTYFVGTLGTSASGATGVVFGLMAILQAVGFMFGHGAGSIISRLLGSKDIESAKKYSATSFYTALFIGIGMASLGLVFINPLMRILGSTDTILPYARSYATFILLAAPLLISSCVMNNLLRYEGRAFFSMIGLVSGGIINIFLDAYFIRVLGMGIEGAGLATAISQAISFLILISSFIRGKTQSSFNFKYARFKVEYIKEIVLTGLPSLARQSLSSVSTMVLNNIAGFYGGDAAIAAMSIANRICFFMFSVGLGIGQGFQPVAGFNYGAKLYSRVKKGFFFTFYLGTILIGIFVIFGFIYASTVVAWFRDDPEVISVGIIAMRAQCIGLVFVPYGVCNNMMFQSIGKKFNATLLSVLRSGFYFIPILIILAKLFGIFGVQIAQPVADVMTAATCIPFSIHFFKNLPNDGESI